MFLESVYEPLNEATIYFSPRMRVALGDIESSISDRLLSLHGTEVKPDVTLVDMGKPGYLSFTTQRNAVSKFSKLLPSENIFGEDGETFTRSLTSRVSMVDGVWSEDIQSPKQEMRIGKLVNSLFPGEFGDKERDSFVARLTALMETQGEEISVVSGEMISHWYAGENYFSDRGSLGNSCMRNCDYFEIYERNPDVCRMVILTELGRLKGRALIWKINEDLPFEWVMDRRYTNMDHDSVKLERYAEQNGWAYRTHNNHFSYRTFTWQKNVGQYDLSVTMKGAYETYPYMDTFKTYNYHKGILVNKGEGEEPGHFLESTEGDYIEIGNLWSEYHGCYIMEEEAVYSEPLKDWIHRNEAVEVTDGAEGHLGFWPGGHDDIVHDGSQDRWLHVDDTVRSRHHGGFILKDEATTVLRSVGSGHKGLSHELDNVREGEKGLIDTREFHSQGCDWWRAIQHELEGVTHALPRRFQKDWEDRWIPKDLAVKTFRSVDDPGMYLMEDDAAELGVEVDDSKEAERVEDICGYCNRLVSTGLADSLSPESRRYVRKYAVVGQQGSVEGSSSSPD